MKGREGGDAGWIHWLGGELGRGARIGGDATLSGASTWLKWQDSLETKYGLKLVSLVRNPIDAIWNERPARSREPLTIHDLKFAGKSWQDKISELRSNLDENGHDATVLTALDEISWLFNLKGTGDIPHTPMFYAYAIISKDQARLYLQPEKQTSLVKDHLNSRNCNGGSDCVELRDYETIFDDLEPMSSRWDSIILGKKWAYTGGASYAIYQRIPQNKLTFDLSPVMLMKSKKNEVEIKGMKESYIRDSVAIMEVAAILDEEIPKGKYWDEFTASEKLKKLRSKQKYNRGQSFSTISAYGANGAIIHYRATNVTNSRIGTDSLYLWIRVLILGLGSKTDARFLIREPFEE